MSRDPSNSHNSPSLRIRHGRGTATLAIAVDELRAGFSAMLGWSVETVEVPDLNSREIAIDWYKPSAAFHREQFPTEDGYEIERPAKGSVVLRGGSERAMIHASSRLLEELGAAFPPGCPPLFPPIDPRLLDTIEPRSFDPSFRRRAFVSDIMTWNYAFADRLELHLSHDREFIPWMARRGVNAFSYIRHAHDTRLRIDEIAPMLDAHGISAEYGGHVLQILLPRDRFETDPSLFPADETGERLPRGNLCVSNPAALEIVRAGALRYAADYPENRLLHIWGADVWRGAWCRCGACRELSPQHQYMQVVNAVAESLAASARPIPVAYLAYHDTIDPYPGLEPMPNVWLEWAPRERCYSHAIDDPECEINPRYFDSLRRYLEIFDGRCQVFEYYADAILFGGLAFATPGVIARDLRAYRALGIPGVSCLTFGAFSLLAYPVNLETFVRCAGRVGSDPHEALDETAAGRHPFCAPDMTRAYRAVAEASAMVLDYADVMRPQMAAGKARRKRTDLSRAAEVFRRAIDATEAVLRADGEPLVRAEHRLLTYSAEVMEGIVEYLDAKEKPGAERARRGEAAVARIADAIRHVRAIDLEIKGTWGAFDLEWIREIWINALRKGLDSDIHEHQEMP